MPVRGRDLGRDREGDRVGLLRGRGQRRPAIGHDAVAVAERERVMAGRPGQVGVGDHEGPARRARRRPGEIGVQAERVAAVPVGRAVQDGEVAAVAGKVAGEVGVMEGQKLVPPGFERRARARRHEARADARAHCRVIEIVEAGNEHAGDRQAGGEDRLGQEGRAQRRRLGRSRMDEDGGARPEGVAERAEQVLVLCHAEDSAEAGRAAGALVIPECPGVPREASQAAAWLRERPPGFRGRAAPAAAKERGDG